MADTAQLVNPYNHLSYLTPEQATQLLVVRYVVCVVIGAWCWDFLLSLREEYIIFRRKIRIPDVGYIFARLLTGCFLFSALSFITLTWDDCRTIRTVYGIFASLSFSINCLLFLFRIYAVFCGRRIILSAFTVLWLGVFASSLPATLGLPASHIGPTKYCASGKVKRFAVSAEVAATVYDTLVFVAITWQLSQLYPGQTFKERMRAIVSGKGLGRIPRCVLQGGQLYYLVTVGVNILAMILVLSPSIPAAYGSLSALPNIALQNALASRVYRNLKLGYFDCPRFGHTVEGPSVTGPPEFASERATHSVRDSMTSRVPLAAGPVESSQTKEKESDTGCDSGFPTLPVEAHFRTRTNHSAV
ncbi:hypothetical protein BXZ70DRAFT_690440 [Cristinia sonorae]|uniref:Uncharacterized protein n=1 Tax=Cristinia sonorae TaxID=1940300 RepID=A0A8K0UDN6_9AGAR|nr:hypothetical protein BXZ70DRAFT_690440 [Cristinia sonorae]